MTNRLLSRIRVELQRMLALLSTIAMSNEHPEGIAIPTILWAIVPGFSLIACGHHVDQHGQGREQAPEYAIVYNVLLDDTSDNYEVFRMDMDGSDQQNISQRPGVEWSYISVGDRILFISDEDTCQRCYRLYSCSTDGSDRRPLYRHRLADSWMSPRNGGQELIVRPHSSVDTAFYILDSSGTVIKSLRPELPYFSDPLFIEDGSRIVFRGGQTSSKLVEGFQEELYIMDETGGGLRVLTRYPESDTSAGKFGYRAGPPKWHPTEHFISYQSKQAGKYSLYAVTPDGQRQWKLTDLPWNEGWHDWSPDGQWLAIELFDDEQTQFHIGLMKWPDGELKVLTDTTYTYQQCPNFVLSGIKE